MSGLVSNVGLFSGLPTGDIIDQLMALEARPLARIQARVAGIQSERAAYGEISARLLALKGAANQFDNISFFRSSKATSSNPDVLNAIAEEGAAAASYAFRVHSLVTAHQLISGGYADNDQTPVGRGQISVEVGQGHVAPQAFLSDLGGRRGIGRGTIEIQDQAGRFARLDLSDALTLDEVLAAINTEPLIDVRARMSGDGIVLTDASGGNGTLVVRDVGNGTMARDLGIAGSVSASAGRTLRGEDIHDIADSTALSLLNDGNGVHRNTIGEDLIFTAGGVTLFEVELNDRMDGNTHLAQLNGSNGVALGRVRIETADGGAVEVDLAEPYTFDGASAPRGAQTIDDVIEVLNAASGGAYAVSLDVNTNQLVLTDNTSGESTVAITDLDGSSAADLGLTPAAENGVIRGTAVHQIRTIGDVVRAINYAADNIDLQTGTRAIEATLDGNGLKLTSSVGDFSVEAGLSGEQPSGAAADLGILGDSTAGTLNSGRLLAGLGSVLLRSLNGGSGVELGYLEISAKDGTALVVDLQAPSSTTGRPPESLSDVVERINEVSGSLGVQVRASVNAAGNGLAILDETGGSGTLQVADGTAARSLGLVGSAAGPRDTVQGTNLQLQYIAESTRVDTLNQGNGIGTGKFEIQTSDGRTVSVDVTENQQTVGDLINIINVRGSDIGISATINDTGDGIVIQDRNGGSDALTIADEEGQVARSLRLTGTSTTRTTSVADPDNPGQFIDVQEQVLDGRFETVIDIEADDTLSDVAAKINELGLGVSAAVINDGSNQTPYRLSVTSSVTGSAGRLVFDAASTGLQMNTLVEARDAVISFGGSETTNPILIRSSTNTLSDVIDNVTINLTGVSDDTVELNVAPDVDLLVESMSTFVTSFNGVVENVDAFTFFNSETFETGLLRGDPTVTQIDARLREIVNTIVNTGNPSIRRFADIGITFAEGGSREIDGETVATGRDGTISFDESRFREAFAEDPDAVLALFTAAETVEVVQTGVDGTEEVVLDPNTGQPRSRFVPLGLGYRIEEILELLTRSGDGALARRDDALEGQEEIFNQRAAAIQTLLDAKRVRLERQFANLEESIAALTSQQASLSAFQGQATNTSGGGIQVS